MTPGGRIFLVRHGDIGLDSDQPCFVGQWDLPLSSVGLRQAERLRLKLAAAPISGVYCSDLKRSRQMADRIARPHGLIPEVMLDLREVSLGEWEGCSFEEIRLRYPLEYRERGRDMAGYRPPGGESFRDCSLRVLRAFEEILGSAGGDVLISGHAGVNRVLLCHVLGMPLENLFKLVQAPACLNIILLGESGYRLESLNWSPSLSVSLPSGTPDLGGVTSRGEPSR